MIHAEITPDMQVEIDEAVSDPAYYLRRQAFETLVVLNSLTDAKGNKLYPHGYLVWLARENKSRTPVVDMLLRLLPTATDKGGGDKPSVSELVEGRGYTPPLV